MRFFLSFLEQGMGALLTFAINMWMAREGLPASYGVYAFWLGVAWITGTAQSTLVTSHLMSLPRMEQGERTTFERFFLSVQILFICGITFLIAGITLLLFALNNSFATYGTLAFVPGFLLFQYVRALAFSRQKMNIAATLTGSILVFTLISIFLFHILGDAPTPSNGLFVTGIAYAAVSLCILVFLMGKDCIPLPWRAMQPYMHTLRSSGWIIIGAGSSELTNRLFSFVVAGHYGASALAVLSATQITIRPAWMLSAAWSSAELPRLSHMWHEKKFRKFYFFIACGLIFPVVGSLVWTLLVWWSWHPLTHALYRGQYENAASLILFWGGNVVLGSIISALSCGFLASRTFKALAFTDVAGAIAAVIGVISVTKFLPLQFVIAGTMAGQSAQAVALAIGLYFLYKKQKSMT